MTCPYLQNFPNPEKMAHNKICLKSAKKLKTFFVHSIKTDLSTKELKAIDKFRGIKGYKSMSEDKLLSPLTLSKPVKKVKNQKQVFLKQEQKRSENNLMN